MKEEDIASPKSIPKKKNTSFSFVNKLSNIFSFIINTFSSLKNKINSCLSKSSIII